MKKIGVSMDWFKSSRGKKTEDYEKDYLLRLEQQAEEDAVAAEEEAAAETTSSKKGALPKGF